MNKKTQPKVLTDAEYLDLFENFDPSKWREGTPEELAEHREKAKDAVIVEIEEIDESETVEIENPKKTSSRHGLSPRIVARCITRR